METRKWVAITEETRFNSPELPTATRGERPLHYTSCQRKRRFCGECLYFSYPLLVFFPVHNLSLTRPGDQRRRSTYSLQCATAVLRLAQPTKEKPTLNVQGRLSVRQQVSSVWQRVLCSCPHSVVAEGVPSQALCACMIRCVVDVLLPLLCIFVCVHVLLVVLYIPLLESSTTVLLNAIYSIVASRSPSLGYGTGEYSISVPLPPVDFR